MIAGPSSPPLRMQLRLSAAFRTERRRIGARCASSSSARQWIDHWRHRQAPSQLQLWKMCIKLPMYSVAVVPVLSGAACAYLATGHLAAAKTMNLLTGAILVILWLNLSNDAFDAGTDVDRGDRKPESILNLTGWSGSSVLTLAFSSLAAGVACLAQGIAGCGSAWPAGLLAVAIACGYIYQGPPFRLSYKGLGELLCFIAFGPAAVTSFFLCHALPQQQLPVGDILQQNLGVLALSSTIVGLTTSTILFCSHFHQIAGDRAAGKQSPVVKLGTAAACKVLTGVCVATHALMLAALSNMSVFDGLSGLALLPLPAAYSLCSFAYSNHRIPRLVKPLKLWAIRWHCAVNLILALVFITAGVNVHGPESIM